MKKKVKDKVYLQKYDISFITHELPNVPACIVLELFNKTNVYISNGYEDAVRFGYCFTGEAADWIMAQDWLVDYDEFAEMSVDQIKEIWAEEHNKFQHDVSEFNAQDDAYKDAHFREKSEIFDKCGHRLRSLSLMRLYISGEKWFDVPGVKRKRRFFG